MLGMFFACMMMEYTYNNNMEKKMKKLLGSLLLMMGCMSMQASAHLIYLAYDDLGDGTVDMYSQHWHGVTEAPGNGILFTNVSDTSDTYLSVWGESIATKQTVDDFSGIFTQGWDLYTGRDDQFLGSWLVARGVLLNNGLYNITETVGDMVTAPAQPWTQISVTGVTSVPEPSTLAIFALGLMGLASRRFKKQS